MDSLRSTPLPEGKNESWTRDSSVHIELSGIVGAHS